jgi:hypothetical protein
MVAPAFLTATFVPFTTLLCRYLHLAVIAAFANIQYHDFIVLDFFVPTNIITHHNLSYISTLTAKIGRSSNYYPTYSELERTTTITNRSVR